MILNQILVINLGGNQILKVKGNDHHSLVNPLTPMSDQDIISPYNINTMSSR